MLHACFNKAAIPNLYLNFLRAYRENPAYFPAVYTGHTRAKAQRDPTTVAGAKVPASQMHADVATRVGPAALADMVALRRQANELRDRLHAQRAFAPQVPSSISAH